MTGLHSTMSAVKAWRGRLRLGKEYGGIMIWELSQDGAPPNSLYQVIAQHFPRKERW